MLTSRSRNAGFFKDIIYCYQIKDIVENKFWSKLEYECWDFETGQLKYNSAGSEFSDSSIIEAFEKQGIFDRISSRVKALEDRKSILIFVPTVKIAQELSLSIPSSAVVWGDMDTAERDYTIKAFKNGQIRVVINVNVLSVGFDHPEVDCVVIGRPTASLSWFYQALGRGTRISHVKENCLIIDFVGNTDRFGRVENLTIEKYKSSWQVFSGDIQLTSIPITEIGTVKKEKPPQEGEQQKEGIQWPYGKHKGVLINAIPTGYLKWVLENFTFNDFNKHLKKAINEEIKSRSLSDVEKITA
jgi:DNA repair protein RadD